MDKSLKELLNMPNLRDTAQRQAIYDYLTDCCKHPSAEDIYQALKPDYPTLSLATVYNTLELLVKAGLVNTIGNLKDNKTHFDADLTPHVHLFCSSCEEFLDLDTELIEQVKDQVIQQSGYKVTGSRLVYYGLCPNCQQTSVETEDKSKSNHKEK
ncbi:MAG: transcriptional repressor [Chloroflexi bacterium]|nr:transcriptional repressor [Chloroflexota bacterium]